MFWKLFDLSLAFLSFSLVGPNTLIRFAIVLQPLLFKPMIFPMCGDCSGVVCLSFVFVVHPF